MNSKPLKPTPSKSLVVVQKKEQSPNSGESTKSASALPDKTKPAYSLSMRDDLIDRKVKTEKQKEWIHYWESQTTDVKGVMDGHDDVSKEDLDFSLKVFHRYKQRMPCNLNALDCGAGIGRITSNILIHHFQKTDLIEPAKNLI